MKKTGRLTPTKYCRVIIHAGGAHRATCVVWGEDVEFGAVPFTEDHVEFYQIDLDDAGVSVHEVRKIEALPPELDFESITVFRPLKEAAIKHNIMKAMEDRLKLRLVYRG